jgi:PemK-like, MazF-like toxin of type II toxin-antitoxin system
MKLSVSLTEKDVEFLDLYVTEHDLDSRSAAIRQRCARCGISRWRTTTRVRSWSERILKRLRSGIGCGSSPAARCSLKETSTPMTVGRGDIFLVDFEPSRGVEAGKQRPAIIVSNAGMNRGVFDRGWGVLNVVPLTRSVSVIRRPRC